jgi:hypothetical protein
MEKLILVLKKILFKKKVEQGWKNLAPFRKEKKYLIGFDDED